MRMAPAVSVAKSMIEVTMICKNDRVPSHPTVGDGYDDEKSERKERQRYR
jgi:hypothetical protein